MFSIRMKAKIPGERERRTTHLRRRPLAEQQGRTAHELA